MTTTDAKSTLSFNELRNLGTSRIGELSREITAIAKGIEDLDAALICSAERNIDELAVLVGAARRLSTLLDCEGK